MNELKHDSITKRKAMTMPAPDMNDLFGDDCDAATATLELSGTVEDLFGDDVSEAAADDESPQPIEFKSIPASYLFFDIETIPDYSRESLYDLPAAPQLAVYSAENDGPTPSELIRGGIEDVKAAVAKAQSGGKLLPRVILEGCVKMEQAAEKKTRKGVVDLFAGMIAAIDGEAARIEAGNVDRRKKMATSPEMLQIVSMAWCLGDGKIESITYEPSQTNLMLSEGVILRRFWQLAANAKAICGFNSNGFDLPAIFFRSMMLGIQPSRKIDLTPWKGETRDLMALRWPKGGAMKLKLWSSLMGIEVPAGDTDGSQVEELWRKDRKKLQEYNQSDVHLTREIFKRGRGLFWV